MSLQYKFSRTPWRRQCHSRHVRRSARGSIGTGCGMQIRAVTDTDVPAIHAIYAHHVASSLGTFETEAPSVGEMRARCTGIVQAGFPYLVGEVDGRVVGYVYANQFRPRAAYRATMEDSIYVAADVIGRGVGKALLRALIDRCIAQGMQQMLALIGDS